MARTRTVPEEAGRQIVNYDARKNIKQVGGGGGTGESKSKCAQRMELGGMKDPNENV